MFDEEIQAGANRESLSYEGLLLPDGRQISIMPLKTREVSGFPLYDESRLILTKSTRPYWLPVTRAQYYQAIIRVREGVVADSEKQMAQTKDPYQEWVSQREERRQTREQTYKAMKARDPKQAEQFLQTMERMEVEMQQ